MTMLQTFDLKGNKQSFAGWISNLSPCETPFTSMIGKEQVDQTQYSWQTDRLAQPTNDGFNEGSAVVIAKPGSTTVHTNFTKIFRKAVRVADTTKKIALYGRASELAYQMEKAGMEIKRDLEHYMLNSREAGAPGTATVAGKFSGVQKLVAAPTVADADTGAIVHKVVSYAAAAHAVKFTQVQVFDLTYQLYLAGARANKVMVHPANMYIFSDWIGENTLTPHVHRMFDGMDSKFNAHVSTFRDPLGQVFEIIPNRYMPMNQLFFFHEADWTQMILRAPEKIELAKNGSSEKHMIEMEVGLRHRNPFASGILEFNVSTKAHVTTIEAKPAMILADGAVESEILVNVMSSDGVTASTEEVTFTATQVNDDGSTVAATVTKDGATAAGVAKAKVKHSKAARVKVKAVVDADSGAVGAATVNVDTYVSRD